MQLHLILADPSQPLHMLKSEPCQIHESHRKKMRPTDSVRLRNWNGNAAASNGAAASADAASSISTAFIQRFPSVAASSSGLCLAARPGYLHSGKLQSRRIATCHRLLALLVPPVANQDLPAKPSYFRSAKSSGKKCCRINHARDYRDDSLTIPASVGVPTADLQFALTWARRFAPLPTLRVTPAFKLCAGLSIVQSAHIYILPSNPQ